jgi:hypothetical protein
MIVDTVAISRRGSGAVPQSVAVVGVVMIWCNRPKEISEYEAFEVRKVGHWRTGNLWRLLPCNPDPDPISLRRGAVKPGGPVVVVVEVPTTIQSVSPSESVEPASFHWCLTPRTMRVASAVRFENRRLVEAGGYYVCGNIICISCSRAVWILTLDVQGKVRNICKGCPNSQKSVQIRNNLK